MMILVTGGASSGKSACAETLACMLPGTHFYLAAMKPFGEEGARRIARHRALRAGKGFATIECWHGLQDLTVADYMLGCDEEAGNAVAAPGEGERPVGAGEGGQLAGGGEGSPLAGGGEGSQLADGGEVGQNTTALLESLGNVVANELFAEDGTCASFEDALCALALYPDECEEIFRAIADYKIDIIRHAAEYLKPDVFCYMDDVASSQSLMMSVDCYRKLIKPQEARIFKAIADAGMIVEHHICGKFEAVADDILEMGVQMLLPAQSSNDLEAIIRKKPDICFDGGTNTQAAALSDGASEEDGRAEARRCINTYGVNGHYMVHITMLGAPNTAVRAFMDEAEKYGREYVRLKKANAS